MSSTAPNAALIDVNMRDFSAKGENNGQAAFDAGAYAWEQACGYVSKVRFIGRLAGVGTDTEIEEARAACRKAIEGIFLPTDDGDRLSIAPQMLKIAQDTYNQRDGAFINRILNSAPPADGISSPADYKHWALTDPSAPESWRKDAQGLVDAQRDIELAKNNNAKWLDKLSKEKPIWQSMWEFFSNQYKKVIQSFKDGTWKVGLTKLAIDAGFAILEEGAIKALQAGLIASGIGAGFAAVLQIIARVADKVTDVTRAERKFIPHGLALSARRVDASEKVHLPAHKEVPAGRVDATDLKPDETRALYEGNQGNSTGSPTPDHGEHGVDGGNKPQTKPQQAEPPPSSPRSNEELLRKYGGEVPSDSNGEFKKWWNDLTPDELDNLWADRDIRADIKSAVRSPGGSHEWLMTGMGPKLKRLGFSMDDIKGMTTPTKETGGPHALKPGHRWRHTTDAGKTGEGSGAMHQALQKEIEDATSREDLLQRLGRFGNSWLDDGVNSFPPSLRDAINGVTTK